MCVSGHKWSVGIKARRAGAFNGQPLSASFFAEVALVGQDLVRKGEAATTGAQKAQRNGGGSLEISWPDWLRLTVQRQHDPRPMSLHVSVKSERGTMIKDKRVVGVASLPLSRTLVRPSATVPILNRVGGEPIKDDHGRGMTISLDFELQLPPHLQKTAQSLERALDFTSSHEDRVRQGMERLEKTGLLLRQRADEAEHFQMRRHLEASRLRLQLAEMQADAAKCAFDEAELQRHRFQVQQVEETLQHLTGQLSGATQRDILLGMAVTLIHVFLFRLFLG